MVKYVMRSWIALLLAGSIVSTNGARAAERSADEILRDLNAVSMPSFDPSRRSDPLYVAQVEREFIQAGQKRDVLILELLKVDPNHDSLAGLMAEHWRRLPPYDATQEARLNAEIADVLAKSKNPRLRTEAYFARAQADLFKSQQTGILDLSGVDGFLQKLPQDPRGEQLLYMATLLAREEKSRDSLENRILKDFPSSKVAEAVLGARRQRQSIGKPFDIEFTDAISGTNVSMKSLKGKVVVVDFWATWCGPCVAQMPHMKELYARYHGHGVEFIGVSLDRSKEEGGLESLKSFVKENGIGWPQYYQGKFWDGDFSKSWGINAIPAVFVVDTGGRLHAILGGDHLKEKLEKIIPELLGKPGDQVKSPAAGG